MAEARAEIVANVWKLVAAPGDEVGAGDVIAVLETMKMEIPVTAPAAGRVAEVRVLQGEIVQEGDVIAVVE
jgi:biotin carboxyl carrier protein